VRLSCFARERKGCSAIFKNFTSRVLIAIVSLLFGAFVLLDQKSVIQLHLVIVGVIAFLLGLMLCWIDPGEL